ncbi:MAG: hypothetical protein VYE22_00995 [Myxococcota bacterium]|nr:hypothetical protein [Myxococcota bacterium]
MLRGPQRYGLAAAIGALIMVGSQPGRAEAPHYTLAEGVRLAPEVRQTLGQIADAFHARTGRGIHVTSGTRTPREQADAMYDKLRLGVQLTRLYRDYEAASEIQSAYRGCRRRARQRCVREIARVIRRQVRRGCYISRHLRASAVDVRSRDMSRRERRIFEQVVRGFAGVSVLEEGRPPHFHLQM